MEHKRRSLGDWIFDSANYIFMAFAAVITLYPFLHVVFSSFSNPTELVKHNGVMLRPAGFSLDGYRAVLNNQEVYIGYANTIFYVIVGTFLATFLTTVFAYTLSHPRLKYRGILNKIVVVSMFFGGGMIPMYLVVKNLGMLDTRWSVIIPGLLSTYNIMIMKATYLSVPASLEESARLDGANEFQAFVKIILPNVKATIAIIALYYGVGLWNSWFSALLYITDRTKYPLQLFLREILIESSAQEMDQIVKSDAFLEEVVKHATTVVATVPILMVYPFIQKYFVKGTMVGAVKE